MAFKSLPRVKNDSLNRKAFHSERDLNIRQIRRGLSDSGLPPVFIIAS